MVDLKLKFPKNFFNEETRCGYVVTKKMKKVWAVELDLLNEFSKLCKKYDIKWFVDGGTLLGTVRHGGFIPWDDDIDIMMTRAEYDKFCLIAPLEFKKPYFLQTEESDSMSLRCHAQLRNSDTTGILKGDSKFSYTYNQGIFIDIFPFDAISNDKDEVTQQSKMLWDIKRKARLLRHTLFATIKSNNVKGRIDLVRTIKSYLSMGLWSMSK